MIFHVIGYGDVEVDAKFVGAFVLADSVGRPEHHGFGHIANNPLETCTVDFVGHEHELLVPVIPVYHAFATKTNTTMTKSFPQKL